MLLTGQHHPREIVTNVAVLYTMLHLIHGGIVHNNTEQVKLLEQNKYYFLPTVNVDGLAEIERVYSINGTFKWQRKNMQQDPNHPECDSGVDLNRNYGFQFGEGASKDPCSETYMGPHPFSTPETVNMRDFITSKKDEIKFVYNLHSSGDMFFLPF